MFTQISQSGKIALSGLPTSITQQTTIRLKARSHRFYFGLLLLILFLLQHIGNLKWSQFETLQENDIYRQVSGVLLLLYIVIQWALSLLRRRVQSSRAIRLYRLHNSVGLFAPAVYYLHSTRFGYAYLLVLSLSYFTNFAVGLFSREFWHIKIPKYSYYWMITHINLSVLTVILVLFHIGIVLYYE